MELLPEEGYGPRYSTAGGRVVISRNITPGKLDGRDINDVRLYSLVVHDEHGGSEARVWLTQEQFTDMLEGFLAVRESYEDDNG